MVQHRHGVTNTTDVPTEVEPPEGWDGGRSEHTGGGVFNRSYTQERFGVVVEVVYNSETHEGVHVQMLPPDDPLAFLGTLDGVQLFEYTDDGTNAEDCTFENAERAARRLMRVIDEGVHDDEIKKTAEKLDN